VMVLTLTVNGIGVSLDSHVEYEIIFLSTLSLVSRPSFYLKLSKNYDGLYDFDFLIFGCE